MFLETELPLSRFEKGYRGEGLYPGAKAEGCERPCFLGARTVLDPQETTKEDVDAIDLPLQVAIQLIVETQ